MERENLSSDFSFISKTSLKDYKIKYVLGKGVSGTVSLGFNKEGKKVAIKRINRDYLADEDRRDWRLINLISEVTIQSSLNHEMIPKLIEAGKDGDDNIYTIQEFAGYDTLRDFVTGQPDKRLTEYQAIRIFKQLLHVTDYMH